MSGRNAVSRLLGIALVLGAFSGVTYAGVSCANNSPGTNQVTCTGGGGQSLNLLNFNSYFNDGLFAPTTAATPTSITVSASGIPSGATISNVTITIHGYQSAGGSGTDADGNNEDGSLATAMLLVGPKSGSGQTNLELFRCVGGVDSGGYATPQDGSFTLANPNTVGSVVIPAGSQECTGTTLTGGGFVGASGQWQPGTSTPYGVYQLTDNGAFDDNETEPNYHQISALSSMIGDNSGNPAAPGSGLNVPASWNSGGTAKDFSVFNGAQANNETWTLYLVSDDAGDTTVSFSTWDITITYSAASTPSTTTLTPTSTGPTSNTAFATSSGNSVTLTATVTSGATGSVTFTEGANPLTCSQGTQPRPLSGDTAQCTITYSSNSSEGYHSYTGTYSGDGTYETSSGTASVFVYTHATSSGTTYCNSNVISGTDSSAGAPYPSVIYVGDGTANSPSISSDSVDTVSVKLEGFSTDDPDGLRMLLVAPDGTHAYDFWGNEGGGSAASSGTYILQDGATPLSQSSVSPGTWGPADFYDAAVEVFTSLTPAPTPQPPGSFPLAAPGGSASFESSFVGATANGPWALFVNNEGTNAFSMSGWCVDITPASGSATIVGVTSNPTTYATKGSSVTFTAAVTSPGNGTVNEGTVTFTENDAPLPGAPNSGVADVSAGSASISTSGLPEGDNTITATYHDSLGEFNDNTGTETMRVDAATGTPTLNGTTGAWSYCNPAGITIPAGTVFANDFGPAAPNPSNIFVTNLPGTINTATVTFNSWTMTSASTGDLETLLVGPGAATRNSLDFFSPFDGTLLNNFASQTATFSDAYSPLPGNISGEEDVPTQIGPSSNGATSYTASSFYTLPGIQHATTQGHFTLSTGTYDAEGGSGGVYNDTNGNGTWSLYFDETTHGTGSGMTSWCVNLTENAVSVTATDAHSGTGIGGDFVQGEQSAQITTAIINGGTGPTGDPDGNHPLTVVDNLNAAFSFVSGSGGTGATAWSCSATGQAVTCKNHGAIAQGDSYPTLTINVNVSPTATPGTVTNQASITGGGTSGTTNSNSDNITIDPAPSLSVSKNHSNTFIQGSTASWDISVMNASGSAPTSGTITVTDTLPNGTNGSTPYTYTYNSASGTGWSCNANGTTAPVIVTCTYSTPSITGGGSSMITLTVNVPSTSPVSVSNSASAYGGGDLVHTNSGSAAASNPDTVNNVTQVPASVTINNSGSPQSAVVNTAFATALSVTVKDAAAQPIPGVTVPFMAPSLSGASGTFSNSSISINAGPTNASGVATAGVFTADGTAGGPYTVTATASPAPAADFNLTNVAPPSIAKAFNPTSIAVNGTTSLTFTITNPSGNTVALTGVGFTDTLPTGLTVTSASATQCGGFLTVTAPVTIALSGANVATGAPCTFSVTVTGATAGSYTNATGNVTSTNGGTGNTATAGLTVLSPPSIAKGFNPTSVAAGGTSILTLTITNPNASSALTGVAFNDTFPSGMVLASNPAASNNGCGGTIAANGGAGSAGLSNGAISASGTCSISVTVQGNAAGALLNNVQVSSTNGGTGNTANATLTVIAPPTISKAFELVSMIAASPAGATESASTVTITTTSPHGFLTGQSATIAGVGVAGYNGTFTIASVPTTTTFTYTDTNTGLAASGGGTATVPITTMPLNGTATLAFTLTNANSGTPLTGVGFTDPLPSGLQVAATPNASAPCGTFAPNAGDTTLSFSGGTLAGIATCTVSVNITAITAGSYTNTTGNVNSANGGTGNMATASLNVEAPPSISKAFGSSPIALNASTSLTFTITNPTGNPVPLTGVGFTDTLPTGLTVTTATTSPCGGTLTVTSPVTIALSGATVAVGAPCQFSVTVTGATAGSYTNTTGNVTSTNGGTGNTATTQLTVNPGQYQLQLIVSPAGGGSASPNPTNSTGLTAGNYTPGASVTLTATPALGYVFSSWSGSTDLSSTTTDPTTLTMNTNETVTSNFTQTATNATSEVTVTSTGLVYNRITKVGTETVTIKNTGGSSIAGPLQLVIAGFPAGVSAANNTGTSAGLPYWTASAGALAAGNSVPVTVEFSYTAGTSFTQTKTVYSGSLY